MVMPTMSAVSSVGVAFLFFASPVVYVITASLTFEHILLRDAGNAPGCLRWILTHFRPPASKITVAGSSDYGSSVWNEGAPRT